MDALIIGNIAFLLALSFAWSWLDHRRMDRQDAALEEVYGQRIVSVIDDGMVNDEMLLRVFDRLNEFATEVDGRLETLEARLTVQEAHLRGLGSEAHRLRRELRWQPAV